jgi:hypothetical protein
MALQTVEGEEDMEDTYNASSEGIGSGLGNMGENASNMMNRARDAASQYGDNDPRRTPARSIVRGLCACHRAADREASV